MSRKKETRELTAEQLRWQFDHMAFPFETTDDIEPLKDIIGQKRGIDAFRFGMAMNGPGYNVCVTGQPGTGRLSTVKRLLKEIATRDNVPDDLCYMNNFKNNEAPTLLQLKAGLGKTFQKDIHDMVSDFRKEVPQLFDSQDYLNRKKEAMEDYSKKGKEFFKELDKRVKEENFALVDVQMGEIKRPEVMPLVDGKPMDIYQIESMVEKGRFPKDEYESFKEKQEVLRSEIDHIFLELRDLQKEIQKKIEQMDKVLFIKISSEKAAPIISKYDNKEITGYINKMLDYMAENLQIFSSQAQEESPLLPGFPGISPDKDADLQPYQVNRLVDNTDQKGAPVIVESYPTYRNLFGSIERVVDRSGVWRTDFTKIKAGSFIKANGGYLVLNILDALVEPGVWQALKRSLKTNKMEIQTYDPFYLFTTTSMKPEPIEMNIKVVLISDSRFYHMLHAFDEDVRKIFKIRADFDTSMDKNQETIQQLAGFIKTKITEDKLRTFDKTAVAALIEETVRMAGRKEKISTSFPIISDLIRETDYWAGEDNQKIVREKHVTRAIEARICRSSMLEGHLQEMIDRGTLKIDVRGEVVGQVNGLAVYDMGDYMFGKPSRITSTISMGRAGIINIEREADLSGKTHNKGVMILSGYLRARYAQDRPLSISASIAFEQSYGGVDGDSASSAEIYCLLSSISGLPVKQGIAVTGSMNQKGEVQAIGGVSHKIEGFYDCCCKLGLDKHQGVMIPESNIKDLMLRKDVVAAVQKGDFHIFAVKTIDEGIEILTGKKAGKQKTDGSYPKGSVNLLVNEKLQKLAEGMRDFGKGNKDE